MSETSATLLIAAACLFAVGLFTLVHRRDAVGAVLALLLGFNAVASALVGLSGLASRPSEAAQLQSFALVVEVAGALWAAAGVSMAALLRRRTGGQDLLELVTIRPRMDTGTEPGGGETQPPTGGPAEEEAVEVPVTDAAVDEDDEV